MLYYREARKQGRCMACNRVHEDDSVYCLVCGVLRNLERRRRYAAAKRTKPRRAK
jgi:rRNA maturation endonuclease Nob1